MMNTTQTIEQFISLKKLKHNDASAAVREQNNGLLCVSYHINGQTCETQDVSVGTLALLVAQLEGLEDSPEKTTTTQHNKLTQLANARQQRDKSQAIRQDGSIKHLTLVVRESGYPAFKIRYPKKTHIAIHDDTFSACFKQACERVQPTLAIPLKTLLKSEPFYYQRYLSLF